MDIEAVIGANYGDEGKGLVTDWLARTCPKPIVACINGGSQRGHTVNSPEHGKHVFHHFGSGTLAGAPTYFMPSFLLNPMQFVKEYGELKELGCTPVSFRSPRCYIQLPGDIATNWQLERSRGENKHGSVGCGIWETVYRIKHYSRVDGGHRAVTFEEFAAMPYVRKVKFIKDNAKAFMAHRLAEEGVKPDFSLLDIFISDGFINHFIQDTMFMEKHCTKMDVDQLGKLFQTLICENGQGLMLDQRYALEDADHSTPSYTGTIAIAKLIRQSNIKVSSLRCNYVSRTYLTRHGEGRFNDEHGMTFDDPTNVSNEWQGKLRFGELDYISLAKRIAVDQDMFSRTAGKEFDPLMKVRTIFTHCNEVVPKASELGAYDLVSSSDTADSIVQA